MGSFKGTSNSVDSSGTFALIVQQDFATGDIGVQYVPDEFMNYDANLVFSVVLSSTDYVVEVTNNKANSMVFATISGIVEIIG